MKGFRIVLLVFLSAVLGCDGNYKDVIISGQVIDSLTGQSVAGSEINITCWVYDRKTWESRKVLRDTTSDANGNFSVPFEKGEAIDVEVSHPDYEPYKLSMTLDRSINEVDFKLMKKD